MIIIGGNLAQSAAATGQAQRSVSKEKDKAEAARRPRQLKDTYIANKIEAGERVRNLKGNDQEETHEDRQAHDGYDPRPHAEDKPHIDIEG